MNRLSAVFLLGFLFVCFIPSQGLAVDEQPERRVVSDVNLEDYLSMLLEPVAALIEKKRLVLPLASDISFEWQLNQEWSAATIDNSGVVELSAEKVPVNAEGDSPVVGLPFGPAAYLDRERDSQAKATKILWNSLYAQHPAADILYGAELAWFGRRSVQRRSNVAFYRWAFQELFRSGERAVLLRDVLKVYSPPVAYGFAQISTRYWGTEEDGGWIYSPVIGRNRQVLASNRTDPLFGGLLTYDDLFVWSGKVQSVKAQVVAEKTLLIPFPALNPYRLAEEPVVASKHRGQALERRIVEQQLESILTARGYYKRSDDSATAVVWNYESKRYAEAAAWVPVSVYFVPRDCWIVELEPLDPYVLHGKQYVVIEKRSFLPFYKLEYNRRGDFQRLVMGGWVLASTEQGEARVPFAGFVLAVDQAGEQAAAFTPRYVRTFFGRQSDVAAEVRELLEIGGHGDGGEGAAKEDTEQRDEDGAEETGGEDDLSD